MPNIADAKILMIATDGFEDSELLEPRQLRKQQVQIRKAESLGVDEVGIRSRHQAVPLGRCEVDKEVFAQGFEGSRRGLWNRSHRLEPA